MNKKSKDHVFLILFALSSIAVIGLSFYVAKVMNNSAELIAETSLNELVALSEAASGMVIAEGFEEYWEPEDMEREDYLELKARLIGFCDQHELAYTYFLRNRPEIGMQSFIIDNTPVDYTALAEEPVIPEPGTDLAYAGVANAVEIGSYSEGWEGYMTAYAPVYYADGTLSDIIVGVDKVDVNIKKEYDIFRRTAVVLVFSVVIVVTTGLISVILYQKTARQSRVASVSKSTFLSNTSHEMRTPMNAIIGMSEIANRSDDIDQIKYCLGRIDNAARHLLGIINDVLDISKIEAGKLTLLDTCFETRQMLQDVSDVMKFSVENKKQKLVIYVSEAVPQYLVTDRQHLAQVITNLLSNAVKFSPQEGEIQLATDVEEEGKMLRFTVSDKGIGITKEQQERLFHSFEQADTSISRRYGGTGLGLAISKAIVEMMGGTIWVESTPGEGSNFCFTIPNREGEAPAETGAMDGQSGDEEQVYRGKRMLLVEDVAINREILCALLKKRELQIDVAENGLIAVERFRQQPSAYDIIFMDIQMPEMDGYTATQNIRAMAEEIKEAATVPIVAMTANVFKEDIDKCLAAGMNGHLGKPIDVAALNKVLDEYLGER